MLLAGPKKARSRKPQLEVVRGWYAFTEKATCYRKNPLHLYACEDFFLSLFVSVMGDQEVLGSSLLKGWRGNKSEKNIGLDLGEIQNPKNPFRISFAPVASFIPASPPIPCYPTSIHFTPSYRTCTENFTRVFPSTNIPYKV